MVEELHIQRCLQPIGFGTVVSLSIHHFSDASENGYGQCSYLRLVNQDGKIHCSLLVGKSRVPPKKFVSIPRLELTAAVLSVKMACTLRKELGIKVAKEIFWTDSQVVLAYIRSNSKRFKVFVANQQYSRYMRIQALINGLMFQPQITQQMMHQEGLILLNNHQTAVGSMDHLFYGKQKIYGLSLIKMVQT